MRDIRGGMDSMRQLFGRSKEADWAIGGAAIGFTAGILQFLSNSALNIGEKNRRASARRDSVHGYADHKTGFLQKRKINRKQFKEFYETGRLDYRVEDNADVEEVYDYADYVLNQQLETQAAMQHKFIKLKALNKMSRKSPSNRKNFKEKIMDYTSQNFGSQEALYHPSINAYVGIAN